MRFQVFKIKEFSFLKELGKKVAHLLELLMALYVLVAIVVQMVNVTKELYAFATASSSESFLEMLAGILVVVVGIEFFALLCKPSVERVLEVILFVLARHMIVHETSAIEDLIVVVSIAIVVLVDAWIRREKGRSDRER